VGGTLLASALAVMAAKRDDHVASLTLLTTMLDYSDTGEIGLLVPNRAWRRASRRSATAACSRARS
jgi:polyhydroxyalkanoate synthase